MLIQTSVSVPEVVIELINYRNNKNCYLIFIEVSNCFMDAIRFKESFAQLSI